MKAKSEQLALQPKSISALVTEALQAIDALKLPETECAKLRRTWAETFSAVGQRAAHWQIQQDAEAICYYCSAHDEYEPALWMDEEHEPGDYRHKYKKGRGSAWCQASLIWAAWDEHQSKGNALDDELAALKHTGGAVE